MKQVKFFCDICGDEIDEKCSFEPSPINLKSCNRVDQPISNVGFISHPCESCKEKIHSGMADAFRKIVETIKKEKK